MRQSDVSCSQTVMSMAPEANLAATLQAASHLVPIEKSSNTSSASTSLEQLLQERLEAYFKDQGELAPHAWSSLSEVELATATEALSLTERIDALLRSDPEISLGTRDWRILRTLISLVFKWGGEVRFRTGTVAE